MPFRRRRSLIQKVKTPIQHADTVLANVGAGTVPQEQDILLTETGSRTTTGATQTTKSFASTAEVVNIGDIVKYINLFVEICPRQNVGVPSNHSGWLEWAIVMVKETETAVPITQTGSLTLGVICNNMFRNECVFSGAIPCGQTQSNSAEIKIKVPRSKQRIRIGDNWRFVTYWRSSSSTDVTTDTIRLVKSYMYKSYS